MKKLLEKLSNSKCMAFFRALVSKRYFPLLFAGATLVIIYLAYFIFAFSGPIPTLTGLETASELWDIFRVLPEQYDFTVLKITIIILLILESIIVYVLIDQHLMTVNRAVFLILIAAFIVRVGYGISTDGIVTRQYDLNVGSSNGNGHYGITMYIYNHWALPDRIMDNLGNWDLSASYAMYHPMFSHITWALFMHFNSLFMGSNIWVLYQSVRIMSIFLSCLSIYFIYLTLKELKLQGNMLLIALSILAFSPPLYRLAGTTNNDALAYFFIFLGILFTVRWLNKPTIGNIVGIALALGLGMASKLTAALVAFPVAGVFIYRLIVSIKEKKTLSLLLSFVVFAVIVFPLGLFFPIRSYILYNQPFTYIWHNLNQGLLVENTNVFDRFLSFPLNQYFKNVYEIIWRNSAGTQDYNIYTSAMKSFLFGEFSFGDITIGAILSFINLILVLTMTISLIFLVSNAISTRKIINKYAAFFLGGLGLTFFISYVNFNIVYPYGCSMDFRYIIPVMFPIAFIVSSGYALTQKETAPLGRKHFGSYFFPLVVGAFCLASIAFYISAI